MTEPRTAICSTCRFWGRDEYGRALGGPHCDGSVSDCRRRAPIAINSNTDRIFARGEWPSTSANAWCGEWEPEAEGGLCR